MVQLYQRIIGAESAQGVLGAKLDVEWVHFIFNAGLGILMLMMFFGYQMYRAEWRTGSPLAWFSLVTAMVVQIAWHVPEHAVRMYQWFNHGWNPAPGILGHTPAAGAGPFDLLLLHFWYNIAVTAPLLLSWFAYRAYLWPLGRGSRQP